MARPGPLGLAHREIQTLRRRSSRHASSNDLDQHPYPSLFLLVHDDCLSHEMTESLNTYPLTRSLNNYILVDLHVQARYTSPD